MDDIRRPYRGERRNYAIPGQRPPAPHPPVTDLRPAAPARQPASPPHSPHQPIPHPAHQTHNQTETLNRPASHAVHHSQAPAPHHQPAYQPRTAAKRLPGLKIKQLAVAAIFALAAVFGGYLLLKPDKAKVFTPVSLAKQASFGFYYPSPLPAGYSYVNNLNAFQDGQTYYMLGSGNKHIVVREQRSGGSSLNLTGLSKPITFQAAGGKAAVGEVAGQPGGLVLSGSTLITLNSTGDVPPADLTAVINNLKLVNR
jgi:hypothetical protein